MRKRLAILAMQMALLGISVPALGQGFGDSEALLASQREAMAALAFMDGAWRGSAWMIVPGGEKLTFTQTERVGPFLDGAVKVIEGRGYDADGSVSFNALGVVSYDPGRKVYSMRSYARGHMGDFELNLAKDGFTWEIAAGTMTIRYTAVIKDGTWHEIGERIVPGGDPIRFLEMTLTRVGDTDWPAAGAIARE